MLATYVPVDQRSLSKNLDLLLYDSTQARMERK